MKGERQRKRARGGSWREGGIEKERQRYNALLNSGHLPNRMGVKKNLCMFILYYTHLTEAHILKHMLSLCLSERERERKTETEAEKETEIPN